MSAEVWQFIGALAFFAAILVGSYWFVYLPGKTPDERAADLGKGESDEPVRDQADSSRSGGQRQTDSAEDNRDAASEDNPG